MLEALVSLLRMLGMPTSSSIVLATLLLEARPMDLNELHERTGYAKSHLSSSLRLLEEKKLVERIIARGRRALFRARREALRKLLHEHLSELRRSIHGVIEELGGVEEDERLREIEENLLRILEGMEG